MNYDGCKMWFGTVEYSDWIDSPLSGAESTPGGWSDGGVYLGGDGFAYNSWNTHKNYTYAWPSSSSREMAQLMQSYRSGTYGRGKLYWVEPTTYDTNVLAAKWADPSITLDYEGPSLVPGVTASAVQTSSSARNKLPIRSAYYNLLNSSAYSEALMQNDQYSVFIPIPDGMQLNVGAFYSASSASAGVYVAEVLSGGTISSSTRLAPLENDAPNLFGNVFQKQQGQAGVRLFIAKTAAGAHSVTISAIHARLSPSGVVPDGPDFWLGGQGHSGARFTGTPMYITNNGVGGGQIEYAASFRESVN